MKPLARCFLLPFAMLTFLAPAIALPSAEVQKAPAKARPKRAEPPAAKPATPTPPEPPATPAPPPSQDVRFKSIYTTGDTKTESVTLIKGERERFEFQDMILLKQPDEKRTIQISKSANMYLVSPDNMPPTPVVPGTSATPPKPPGTMVIATTVVDTGERKEVFGRQARHVKTMIDKRPGADACDTSRQRIETDGWYIDTPGTMQMPASSDQHPGIVPHGCADKIETRSKGDLKLLGFPVSYTTTVTDEDEAPTVAKMEVTELEQTTLDPELFEIPPGMKPALNLRELSKALSDANELQLATGTIAATSTAKRPGVVRIAVPEFANKTSQAVDTRMLRQRLIMNLGDLKFEGVPMAISSLEVLQKRANELGCDYLLVAEVTELKASKPGGFGGLLKAASGVAGTLSGSPGAAGGAAPAKENTESSIRVTLLQTDGKQILSTTSKGKDGSGFSLKTGLGLAKFAGTMYMSMFAGPQMYSRLNGHGAANFVGMGILGNPVLYQLQTTGLGLNKGAGTDSTAGAASYLMQQAVTMNGLGALVGMPGQGPSYDESLAEAVHDGANAVQKALAKKKK